MTPSRRAFLVAAAAPPAARAQVHVQNHGAKGDGKTLGTRAIQAAIDACHAAGGGRVVLSQGAFLTGTIRLKSHVTLFIDAGASLVGSPNITDYPKDAGVCDWHPRFSWGRELTGSMIYAEGAEDIGIEGTGTIDGGQRPEEPRAFPNAGDSEKRRPMMVRFRDCSKVRLRDVTLTNPASFTTFFVACRDLLFDGVRVRSRATGNGDGFDFDGRERVRISNCDLDTGDDAIGLKTFLPGKPNADFVISNCIISSSWAAIRLGPESFADMRNIVMSSCVFHDCRDGFKIQSCEGAVIERFSASHIVMENVLRPFFVTQNRFGMSKHAPPGRTPVGLIRDLRFSEIAAVVPRNTTSSAFDQPCSVFVGYPGAYIENVSISGLDLVMPGGGTAEHASRRDVPELLEEVKRYPEAPDFQGELPAASLYLRHVRDFRMNNARLATTAADARAFLAGDDLEDVSLSEVKGIARTPNVELFRFDNAREMRQVQCQVRLAPGGVPR
jgi:hypothetical protein